MLYIGVILFATLFFYSQYKNEFDKHIKKVFPKFKGFNLKPRQQKQTYTNDPNEWYNANKKKQNTKKTSSNKTTQTKSDNLNERQEELYEILDIIKNDFVNSPYKDKFNDTFGYKDVFDNIDWVYKLENGKDFKFYSDDLQTFKISYDYKTLTFGILYANSIVDLLKNMLSTAKVRSYYKDSWYNDKSYTKKPSSEKVEDKSKLEKLKINYSLRKKQLDGMPDDDPNKLGLENELKVIKNKIVKLRTNKLNKLFE